MEPIEPVVPQSLSTQEQANNAFGLGFEDLLQIVLTQLTFQDPLKPLENFEFVSQLAQFSQIQQGETTNSTLEEMLLAEATSQATSLLGRVVEIPAGAAVLSGRVTSISFENGDPRIEIETEDGRMISGIGLNAVSQVGTGD